MEGKAVFGGGQGKGGEADNKLNIDSIIARLLEGDPSLQNLINAIPWPPCHLLSTPICVKATIISWCASDRCL